MSAYKRSAYAPAFAPASVRRKAEAEEEEKRKKAIDFTSEAAFPSLGSKPEEKKPEAKKLVLNYGGAAAAGAKAPAPVQTVVAAATVPIKKDIVTRCYDELPEDYDGPDEDAELVDVEAEEAEAETTEFNAHLGSRRRGDNGIW